MNVNTHHDAPKPHWSRRAGVLLGALVLAAMWGSVVQTLWNLQALVNVGVDIPFATWLRVIGQDLLGFAPLYGGIVAVGWLFALPVAHGLAFRWPAGRTALLASAAGVGMVAAIRSVDAVAPMPVFIDATRHLTGLLAMAAGAVMGGWIYARYTATQGTTHRPDQSCARS